MASITASPIQCSNLCNILAAHRAPQSLALEYRRLQLRGGEDSDKTPPVTREELMGPRSNIVEAIASKVGRNLHNKIDHPLQIIKTWITEHFCETYKNADGSGPLFECLDTLSPVVTTSMCFDDLLTAADHPSRSRSDTYYLDDHRLLRSHMTAHQTSLLREGRRSLLPAAFCLLL